jgi:hypothetical protein
MDRNLLLIAIAAVVLIGIAAGILLVGNGQSPGGLAGALGPTATTLTLNVSTCAVSDIFGNVGFTLAGELRDSAGNGLANKTIGLRWASYDNGHLSETGPTEFTTTDQNGGFRFTRNEPPTPNYGADTYVQYGAAFAGDQTYATSSSPIVRRLC